MWDVIGAVAGVVGAVAAFLALQPVWVSARDRRRKRRKPPAAQTTVTTSSDVIEGVLGADAMGSVEPPVGRLPTVVRGHENLLQEQPGVKLRRP